MLKFRHRSVFSLLVLSFLPFQVQFSIDLRRIYGDSIVLGEHWSSLNGIHIVKCIISKWRQWILTLSISFSLSKMDTGLSGTIMNMAMERRISGTSGTNIHGQRVSVENGIPSVWQASEPKMQFSKSVNNQNCTNCHRELLHCAHCSSYFDGCTLYDPHSGVHCVDAVSEWPGTCSHDLCVHH